jgi:hypothetical protein
MENIKIYTTLKISSSPKKVVALVIIGQLGTVKARNIMKI